MFDIAVYVHLVPAKIQWLGIETIIICFYAELALGLIIHQHIKMSLFVQKLNNGRF